MTTPYLLDFSTLINAQMNAHTVLAEHLLHTQQVMEFTLNTDLTTFKPSELHAQLLSIVALIQKAEEHNDDLIERNPLSRVVLTRGLNKWGTVIQKW